MQPQWNYPMKAIQVQQHGDCHVLKLQEVAKPTPKTGEALVRVKAIGVNFVDTRMRSGLYPVRTPFIPGIEAAGIVEEVGSNVSFIRPGDRVAYVSLSMGSYAEYHIVNAMSLIPLPNFLSFEQGAAFPAQGMTAQYLLHEYVDIKPGTRVLVHAAAGGMGLFLVQWLKHLKAEIFATVSTQEKAQIARNAGADHVILYTSQNFVLEVNRLTNGQRVDYIINGVGKSTFNQDFRAVKPKGCICLYGFASGEPDSFPTALLERRSIHLVGGNLMNYLNSRAEILQRANAVIEGLRDGWLNLHIYKVLPMAEAASAHHMLESRKSTGKIILSVD